MIRFSETPCILEPLFNNITVTTENTDNNFEAMKMFYNILIFVLTQ